MKQRERGIEKMTGSEEYEENYRIAKPGSLDERLTNELEAKLNTYIAGELSLHELREWIVDQPFAIENVSRRLQALYAGSHSRIIRFDSGDWTQDELRESLRWVLEAVNTDSKPSFADPLGPRPFRVSMRPKRPEQE